MFVTKSWVFHGIIQGHIPDAVILGRVRLGYFSSFLCWVRFLGLGHQVLGEQLRPMPDPMVVANHGLIPLNALVRLSFFLIEERQKLALDDHHPASSR